MASRRVSEEGVMKRGMVPETTVGTPNRGRSYRLFWQTWFLHYVIDFVGYRIGRGRNCRGDVVIVRYRTTSSSLPAPLRSGALFGRFERADEQVRLGATRGQEPAHFSIWFRFAASNRAERDLANRRRLTFWASPHVVRRDTQSRVVQSS